jgi:DNA (cytosine-5)-methyltransferase 1
MKLALDLFCCAGGAAEGLNRAGFHVVGVDIKPQPNYPFAFVQADVMNLEFRNFALIWASPPCQRFSDLAKRNGNAESWPDLIDPIRNKLVRSKCLYVIENVEGAPLNPTVMLCGTMFPGLRVLRHRMFEANFKIEQPAHGEHVKVHTFDKRKSHFGKTDEMIDFVQVTGGGNCTLAAARDAMGIDWMTKGEINEAIPPAYAEHIGMAALEALCDCQHPIPTASGFAAVSEDCPIHGGDFQVLTTVL